MESVLYVGKKMCGIAGFVKKQDLSIEEYRYLTEKMIEEIRWRGPDGYGVKIWQSYHRVVSFGHCRLSILDLSDNGIQPMETDDGRYAISYNGEIFNYLVIKKELEGIGYIFKSTCDTEILLYACVEWGVSEAVSKCNGMFAFAFYDREKECVFLCRDRMGIKPLYYQLRNGELSFSSDLRALMVDSDFQKDIDFGMVYFYLWNMYIPGSNTIFKNTYKLESGSILRFDVINGNIIKKKFWDIDSIVQSECREHGSYHEFVYEIKELLIDSIKIRLEADVPVGIFLSGGIDSSLITSIAQDISGKQIHSYSIGFKEKKNDDAIYAKDVARILGTKHTEIYCTGKDALNVLEHIPNAFSEPFSDSSLVPTMILSKLTKDHVTVALSGDGGDELFVGYPSMIAQNHLYRLRFIAKVWSNTGGRIINNRLSLYSHKRWKSDKLSNSVNGNNILFLDFITAMEILDTLFLDDTETMSFNNYLDEFNVEEKLEKGNSFFECVLAHGIKSGLKDDMLVKIDRASMYYSLETRCPLLDYRIVEKAIAAPLQFKYRQGILKSPLKDILSEYIPESIIKRPKMGFGMPVDQWIHGEWNSIIQDYLSRDYIIKQGIFAPDGIEKFVKEFNNQKSPILNKIAFSLLNFQLWWDRYVFSY